MTECRGWISLQTFASLLLASFFIVLSGCGLFGNKDSKKEEKIERSQAPLPTAVAKKPTKHQTRVSQFLFHSDVPLETNDPLFRELEDLPEQVQQTLQIQTSPSFINVYLFEDQLAYEAYIHSRDPKLPKRPAYFFSEQRGAGLQDELIVTTYMSKRLRTDLRHELTHALLHGVFKTVPLWLDEGLAGYFEQPAVNHGINFAHLTDIQTGQFLPNLSRLEKLSKIEQMERPEYEEAWAWVHWMIHGDPAARKVLLDYLKTLKTTTNPGSLHSKLLANVSDPHQSMLEYVTKLKLPSAPRVRPAGK